MRKHRGLVLLYSTLLLGGAVAGALLRAVVVGLGA